MEWQEKMLVPQRVIQVKVPGEEETSLIQDATSRPARSRSRARTQPYSTERRSRSNVVVKVPEVNETDVIKDVTKRSARSMSRARARPYSKERKSRAYRAYSLSEEKEMRNVIQDRLETLQGRKEKGAKEKAPPSPPQRRVKEKRKADRMGWHQEIENRSGLSSKKRERSQKRNNV